MNTFKKLFFVVLACFTMHGYAWAQADTTMIITNEGNVGIGTTSPAEKLSVEGIISSLTGGFMFPDGTIQSTAASGGNSSGGGSALNSADGSIMNAISVNDDGSVSISREANGIIGFPDQNASGKDLTIKAGGNISSHGAGSFGGNLILRAGNANISGPSTGADTSPFENNVFIFAGDNVFGGVNGTQRNGDVVFFAGHGQPERFRIRGNDGAVLHNGTVIHSSDRRGKTNIETISDALGTVLNLRGVTYDWKKELNKEQGTQYGFIAQEVEMIVPDLVGENSSDERKYLNYVGVIPLLVEAVKELHDTVDAQNDVIQQAKAELIALNDENQRLSTEAEQFNMLFKQVSTLQQQIEALTQENASPAVRMTSLP